MVRTLNMEGIAVELPDSAFAKSAPPSQNEKIIGLSALLILFAMTLPWGSFFSALSIISPDIWVWIAILLVILLKFVMLLVRIPMGGALKNGYFAGVPNSKQVFFIDALGEMAILIGFCALIILKNPLVFAFGILLLIGRFRAAHRPERDDFERWYPATVW
jgi:hypothetical protein